MIKATNLSKRFSSHPLFANLSFAFPSKGLVSINGGNGSGKTTLGRELAYILDYKHIDHEDYAFEQSDIPYTVPRLHKKCVELMLTDIEKSEGFVLSAVTGDFGNEIESLYALAVYIVAPKELRIERVKQRGIERYGERVLEGGNMYEQQKGFVEFVAARPLSRIEQWIEALTCPVIHIDGTVDWRENAKMIAEKWRAAK